MSRRSSGRHRKSRMPSRRTLSVVTGAAGLVVAVTTGAIPVPLVSPGDAHERDARAEPVTLLRRLGLSVRCAAGRDRSSRRRGLREGRWPGSVGSPDRAAPGIGSHRARRTPPRRLPTARSRRPSPLAPPRRARPARGGPSSGRSVPLPLPTTVGLAALPRRALFVSSRVPRPSGISRSCGSGRPAWRRAGGTTSGQQAVHRFADDDQMPRPSPRPTQQLRATQFRRATVRRQPVCPLSPAARRSGL